MEFQLALCQMLVEGGAIERNLARAERMIAQAAAAGADMVLLPETMDLGWTHPSAVSEAQPVPDGAPCRRLAAAAARHGVFVCAGLTERESDRVYNCAVLLGRDGGLLLRHRKLNELDIGHDLYAQGDRLNVAHTQLGTVGVMICADGFAKDRVLSRALGYMGADFILSPSAWAVPADYDNTAQPYSRTWLECIPPRSDRVWDVDRRREQCRPDHRGPLAGHELHRRFARRFPGRRDRPSGAVRRGRRGAAANSGDTRSPPRARVRVGKALGGARLR